ncbi:hypothetical protein RB653_003368, partial [Dictyostelium firmibasis]
MSLTTIILNLKNGSTLNHKPPWPRPWDRVLVIPRSNVVKIKPSLLEAIRSGSALNHTVSVAL